MIWLVILTPLFILIPFVLYLDRKRTMGHPAEGNDNTEHAMAESERAKKDVFLIPPGSGGDGGGPMT
ncbi:hypothetical protein [Bacillus sp. FJAT-27251]|uniref:hypothetical protein n=1 Tax=Bacillus sp. FJAT-27251 TaxID=1684142 RepID=UPI0006A7D1B7|nr:hypothetical protein [Bacillus sp. FJAT-27251]